MKLPYKNLTRVKNGYQILTHMQSVRYWYEICDTLVPFFTYCEELVLILLSVKFMKCEICSSTKLPVTYKSVSNVGSHSGHMSCTISLFYSLTLLHSNNYCLVVSISPQMHNVLSMVFFEYRW